MDQIANYLPGIILAYSVFFVAIASPGPNVLAVIGTSMAVGRASGIALALGVAAGSFCWALMTAAGLSALIAHYAAALTVIKIGGGCYLLWLSYKSFRAAASVHDLEAKTLSGATRSPFGYALRGFTIQMTNPKAALAWIAIISLGLQTGAPWWVGFAVVAGTSMLSVIIHCVYAVAFSTRVMVRAYGKARRYVQATLGALFAFAGLKMLTSRT
jgi:amino acid exporter